MMTTTMRLVFSLGMLIFARQVVAQDEDVLRPKQYPPTFSQFMVSSWADCRTVSVMRLGAGPKRPAEIAIFEIAKSGGELRRLHHLVLRNPYLPWSWIVTGAGRFLVTLDDRWVEGQLRDAHVASTGNCLVVYDMVRGGTRALASGDFLSSSAGDSWYGPWIWVDPLRNQVFLIEPDECERSGKPFIVVDLPTAEVWVSHKAPKSLPDGLVKPHGVCDIGWDWSSGGASEPSWGKTLELPDFLLVSPQPTERGKEELSRVGVVHEQICYQLDRASGNYVKCEMGLWVKRRVEPAGDPGKPAVGDK